MNDPDAAGKTLSLVSQGGERALIFAAKRKRALKISSVLISVTMFQLTNKHYPKDERTEKPMPSRRWVSKWANKHNITKRRKSNSKVKTMPKRLPKVQQYHLNVRNG